MKSKVETLRNRGLIDDLELDKYNRCTFEEIIELLSSDTATDRTIAAKLLAKFKTEDTLNSLISSLEKEKKLYAKLAICETLESFGSYSCHKLINYLGKIGKNQHQALPDKPFTKKSYPLPRDIIARVFGNIGIDALPELKSCLKEGHKTMILEAIDAIGFISFYNKNNICLEEILEMTYKYKSDDLMIWKLLRCLQSFDNDSVRRILKEYSTSSSKQLKWEASRSLDQLNSR